MHRRPLARLTLERPWHQADPTSVSWVLIGPWPGERIQLASVGREAHGCRMQSASWPKRASKWS